MSTRTPLMLLCSAVLMIQSGCGCSPKAYNVTVNLAPSLQDRTVYVDLVGVNQSDGKTLSDYSMTKYWQPSDSMRGSLDSVKLTFLAGDGGSQTLEEGNATWEADWANATDLYVLARLPGIDDKPGEADPRRLVLPLGSCRWDGGDIEIEVTEGLVRLITPMLPEE